MRCTVNNSYSLSTLLIWHCVSPTAGFSTLPHDYYMLFSPLFYAIYSVSKIYLQHIHTRVVVMVDMEKLPIEVAHLAFVILKCDQGSLW